MQGQQNRCPHSVAQLDVRSSKHSVQFRLARIADGTLATSRIVRSSSSAGIIGCSSGLYGPNKVDTGVSSINVSRELSTRCFPLPVFDVGSSPRSDRRNEISRCSNRIASRIPSKEYEGGLALGFGRTAEIYSPGKSHD